MKASTLIEASEFICVSPMCKAALGIQTLRYIIPWRIFIIPYL